MKASKPSRKTPRRGKKTLAVDIGGSGIKAIVLNEEGIPVTDRGRLVTPKPATPKSVLRIIRTLAKQQGTFDRVSVGFPGVVKHGVTVTAPNLDSSWEGFDLAKGLSKLLGKPVRVANDADVQGYGAITGKGVELVVTLGTGFGSALFVNGHLVPNLEIAHHPFKNNKTYEQELGAVAFKRMGKKKWNQRLWQAIEVLDALFNYDVLYIGGGNGKKVSLALPDNVQMVPNVAGLLGGIAFWRDAKK